MSQKITPKNLTYDSSLPPFLARLRGQQQAARDDGPDPLLAAHRRPGQKRTASEEAEDAPLIVDEDGNVVTDFGDDVVLDEDGSTSKTATTKDPADSKENSGDADEGMQESVAAEKVAGIGASRKRKVGRVIGEAGDEAEGKTKSSNDKDAVARIAKASADARRLLGSQHDDDEDEPVKGQKPQQQQQEQNTATVKSTKKKTAKKIKLSFGDD